MKSANYLIVGNRRDAYTKALAIANDFFDTPEHLTHNLKIISEVDQKITVSQIEYLLEETMKSAISGHKTGYIVRDASAMTKQAQNKLLKVLEESSGEKIQIFCDATDDGLIGTLHSRLMTITLPQPQKIDTINFLKTELVPDQYVGLLTYLFNNGDEALDFYLTKTQLLNDFLKFIDLYGKKKTAAYLYYDINLEKSGLLFLKVLEFYFKEAHNPQKILEIAAAYDAIDEGADQKMQINKILLTDLD